MSIEITHPEKPTEQDKIDDNDYMLPHKITGVLPNLDSLPDTETFIPVLIESKTLPSGTTTVTFSDLDGDKDVEYLIKGEITTANMTYYTGLDLLPNNIIPPGKAIRHRLWTTQHGYNDYDNRLQLFNNHNMPAVYGYFEAHFHAKTGTRRLLKSETVGVGTDLYAVGSSLFIGVWDDTTTKVTSLVIKANSGSFSGVIKLYKIVNITLEDLTPT